MYQSTEFRNISKKTNTKIMIFRAVILGFLLGIIFVFFQTLEKIKKNILYYEKFYYKIFYKISKKTRFY